MSTSNKALLDSLVTALPSVEFVSGERFVWSPSKSRISYDITQRGRDTFAWRLLHEVGHALLGHQHFANDFSLLQLELAAWDRAKVLAKKYGITIPQHYIEDCLDSYRDWLHKRSTCPRCHAHGVSTSATEYECMNCDSVWHVPRSQVCRVTRRLEK